GRAVGNTRAVTGAAGAPPPMPGRPRGDRGRRPDGAGAAPGPRPRPSALVAGPAALPGRRGSDRDRAAPTAGRPRGLVEPPRLHRPVIVEEGELDQARGGAQGARLRTQEAEELLPVRGPEPAAGGAGPPPPPS